MEKKMSEQKQNREPRKPSALNSILTIVGIIVGSIVLLVSLFDIHTSGVVYSIVGGVVLVLVWAIPGILIGLMVFRGFKNKASSRAVIIVAAAFFGIVGGLIVVGVLAFGYAAWIVTTQCC